MSTHIAKFSMYSIDELQVYFTVEADDAESLMDNMVTLGTELTARQFCVGHPALNPTDKIEVIEGWVLGITKRKEDGSGGDPCCYLYVEHPGRKYKVATVWKEDLEKLPFFSEFKGMVAQKQAPEKPQAKIDGVYQMLSAPIEAILKPTDYKTDKGNIVYRFNSIRGFTPAEQKNPKTDNGQRPVVTTDLPPAPFTSRITAATWGFDNGYFATFPVAEEWIKQQWLDRPSSLRVTPVGDDVQRVFFANVFNDMQHRSKVTQENEEDMPF